MISDKQKFIFWTTLFFMLMSFSARRAEAQAASRMYGTIGLTTNYVDRGITQSKAGPSLGAGLGYWFGPQGRIGFEGASVAFKNETANVEMRLLGEYKFIFGANSDLKIRNDLIRYFPEDKRNKMIISADLNLFTYHFLVSREDNFEGTKKPRNWFALHKAWPWGQSLQVSGTVGYSMVESYESYFDALVGINYLMSNITAGVFGSYVSAPDQFAGTADLAVLAKIEARF